MRPHRNRGLFSNYYLDELLPKEEEFKIPISEVKTVFEKAKGIWDKGRFEVINEKQLRKQFLDKILYHLGWIVDVEVPIPTGSKSPDYALFLNTDSLKSAEKGKKEDYFKNVTCVSEAKRWGRPLDKKLKSEADLFEIQNPSLQISRYLWLTGVRPNTGLLRKQRFGFEPWRKQPMDLRLPRKIWPSEDLGNSLASDNQDCQISGWPTSSGIPRF
jgi:hypothetical protein